MFDDDDDLIEMTVREYRALSARLDQLEEQEDETMAALSDLRDRLAALEMRGSRD